MEHIDLIATVVTVLVAVVGLGFYLRSDMRANQAVLAELFRTEIGRLDQKIDSVEERLNQRIDGVETRLTNQMQANHRELLLRLAFHHHGDGRYPIVPSSDPEPVDPTGSN
jgi:hypothetical protein